MGDFPLLCGKSARESFERYDPMKSVPIGEVLERLFAKSGYDRRRRLEALFEEWEHLFGENGGHRVRPLSIEEGVLTVVVPNSTVASEVLFSRGRYLEQVNAYFGFPVVQELRVRIAEGRTTTQPEKKESPREEESFRPDQVPLTREELAWAEENAACVRSLAARTSLRRALLLFLKRQKWESLRFQKDETHHG